MPFNVPSPMVETQAPRRYPSPDWSQTAEVRQAWLPDERPVGWLIIQGNEALSWVSSAGPDRPAAYAIKEIIQDILDDSYVNRLDVRTAWNRCTAAAMFRPPEEMDLSKLAAELQEEWS